MVVNRVSRKPRANRKQRMRMPAQFSRRGPFVPLEAKAHDARRKLEVIRISLGAVAVTIHRRENVVCIDGAAETRILPASHPRPPLAFNFLCGVAPG